MLKQNKFLGLGLFISGMSLILRHFSVPIPDFVYGLLLGTGIGLELIGIYAINHDLSKLRKFKRSFLKQNILK